MSADAVSRRTLLGSAAAAAAAAWLAPAGARAASGKRPNILCLISEDCAATHLGPWGGAAQTPTIDKLAKDGVRFENCFSAAPVCAPSRFAMITGLPPESCGPAECMRAVGAAPAPLGTKGWPAMLRQAGYYCTNNSKTDYNALVDMAATWDESSGSAHWRNRPDGAPFFAIFNPQMTHETAVFHATPADAVVDGQAGTPYEDRLPQTATAGGVYAGGPTSPDDVRIPAYAPDTQTTRDDAAHYLNAVNQMDSYLAERLAELDADGVADDTIVIYYSDHAGVLLRSKRFCYDSGLHIPLIARFGKNVAHLAPAPAGSVLTAPVSSGVDLPVTILTLTGQAAPDVMPGTAFAGPQRESRDYAFSMRNRMDERYDMVRTARDDRYRYIRNYMPHVPYGQHIQFMWIQDGYREWEQLHFDGQLDEVQGRFWQAKPAEELYDLRRDPDEITNLAGDPRSRGVLERMRHALDEHMLASNDNGFIPEGSPLQGWGPSRKPGAYPLRDVMALAWTAIQRDQANIDVLIEQLGAGHEVLRYWAALGCCMLDDRAAAAKGALERVFANDPSVHVRIAAAEALARIGVVGDTVTFLGDTLQDHPDWPVQLYAANALENIGVAARAALPQLISSQKNPGPDEGDSQGGPTAIDNYAAQAARYTARKLTGTYVPSP